MRKELSLHETGIVLVRPVLAGAIDRVHHHGDERRHVLAVEEVVQHHGEPGAREVLAAIVDIEGGKALCRVLGIGGGQVHIDAPPVAQNLAVKVKLLHPPMRDGGHPLQLRRLVEIPHDKVRVLLPYAIVYGVWAERIHDPLPIHDELILDPRRPAKLQRVVKDPGLPQGG